MTMNRLWLSFLSGVLFFGYFDSSVLAQGGPGVMEWYALRHLDELSERFKAGDTNVPLLGVELFKGFIVSRSGKLSCGWSGPVSNTGSSRMLASTNLALFVEAINSLPPHTNSPTKLNGQLHVCGIRSNQWFHLVYDLNDCPEEVKRLLDLFSYAPLALPKSP